MAVWELLSYGIMHSGRMVIIIMALTSGQDIIQVPSIPYQILAAMVLKQPLQEVDLGEGDLV